MANGVRIVVTGQVKDIIPVAKMFETYTRRDKLSSKNMAKCLKRNGKLTIQLADHQKINVREFERALQEKGLSSHRSRDFWQP